MSIRDRFPPAKLPNSHYFLTVSRGDKVRAFAVRPALAVAALAAIPALALWASGATAFIALHDQVIATLLSRETQLQTDYEAKLSDARAEADRVKSRQLLEQNAFEDKMHDLVIRQARLERRGAELAALATEAGADATALADARPRKPKRDASALAAIQAIGGSDSDSDSGDDLGAARAYAPLAPAAGAVRPKPRPLDGGGDSVSRAEPSAGALADELAAAAADSSLAPSARVGLVSYSLDRVERQQRATLAGVDKAARAATQKFETVIARTGLSPSTLKAPPAARDGVGGPYIPLTSGNDAFGRAVDATARDIEAARKLRRLMPHLPLSYPLTGDARVSSPFGYRTDPFLGRPELHPGVDLVQAYGSQIKATAIGRVTHAGPMGGYGNAVDIDHGNGIVTRYGHMAHVLVTDGQMVKAGDVIGLIGTTGRSTGPHLHYEVRVDGEPVNPERFLTAERD
ncbi:MAG TPA: M23 family metallopeptidase [Roseiarcus sp.]|nr:M23 family metallopeptidase [Roseiarcus sp.]